MSEIEDLYQLLLHGKYENLRERFSEMAEIGIKYLPILIENYLETGEESKILTILQNHPDMKTKYPGFYFYIQFRVDEKFGILEQDILLEIEKMEESSEQGYAYLGLAFGFYKDSFVKSAQYAQEAYEKFENDLRMKSIASQLLGSCLFNLNDYQGAVNKFLRSIDLRRRFNNPDMIAETANSLAITMLKLQRYLSAKNWLLTALEEGYRLTGSVYGLCRTNFNQGIITLQIGHLEEAIQSFQFSLVLAKEKNYTHLLAGSLYYLGKILYSKKKYDESINHFRYSLENYLKIINKLSSINEILNVCFWEIKALFQLKNLSEIEERKRNYVDLLKVNEFGKYLYQIITNLEEELKNNSINSAFYIEYLTLIPENGDYYSLTGFLNEKLLKIAFLSWINKNLADKQLFVQLERIIILYQKKGDIPNVIRYRFGLVLLQYLTKQEESSIEENFTETVELADESELPWHYGLITSEFRRLRSSNEIPEEKVIELLKQVLFNFERYLNNFLIQF